MHSKKRHEVKHSASLRPEEWRRFVQMPPFPGQWARTGLDEDALIRLEICLMADPEQGKVVPGSGGLRKVRYAPPGSTSGKSGAYRVFYVHLAEYGTMILWGIIAKKDEKDPSKAETNEIAKRIQRLRQLLEKGSIR